MELKRIDIIGLNGNDGLHYEKVTTMDTEKYYKEKMDYHMDKWQEAIEAGDEVRADYHLNEYTNYEKQVNK